MLPQRQRARGRRPSPAQVPPQELTCATAREARGNSRVAKAEARVVHGSAAAVRAAAAASSASGPVNTAHAGRHDGTDRNRSAREAYCFPKDRRVHEAPTYFTVYSYNFRWPVRTLREEVGRERYRQRTPAMAAGLADRAWSPREWLTYPAVDGAKKGSEAGQQS